MDSIWPVVAGLFLLACVFLFRESRRGQKARINVFAFGDLQENRILIDLMGSFRENHPNIQVELQRFPYPEYIRKVLDSVERGLGPDLIYLEAAQFGDFYFHDLLEPLDPFIRADHVDLKAYYPSIVDRFTVDDRLYALPRDVAPICMVYYNQNAFDEAGVPYPQDNWNWDQFAETAKKVTKIDATGRVVRWGFVEGWNMFDTWVHDAGGTFVDDIKRPSRWTFATDPNSLRGVRFRWELIHKHKVMPAPSLWSGFDDVDGADMFATGRAAMFLFGLWKTPRFREIGNFRWDVAMLPRDPKGHRHFAAGEYE